MYPTTPPRFLRPLVVLEVTDDPVPPALPVPPDAPRWAIHGATPPRWSFRVAEVRVTDWLAMHPEDSQPLILLGPRVCRAFRIEGRRWLDWYVSPTHRHTMIAVPTSAGWWARGSNAAAATETVAAVWSGHLPRYEKAVKTKE